MKCGFAFSFLFLTTLFSFSLKAQNWSGVTPGDIYYNDGNVGIGVTLPVSPLHIRSTELSATFEDDGGRKMELHPGNGAIDMYNGYLHLNRLSDQIVTLGAGGGNVGVGTSNPSVKFQIVSTPGAGGNFKFDHIGEEAFFRMSNAGNWGLMMRSDINHPKIGAYNGGVLDIHPFSSNTGGLDTNKGALTTFNFATMRVGIGTASPDAKLTVKGDIHAEEVRVDLNVPGPDYVFEEGYDLLSLESLQAYILEKKHLPEVPTAEELQRDGIDVGLMNMLLLKKVEELTLYQIELLNMLKKQQMEIETLKSSIK